MKILILIGIPFRLAFVLAVAAVAVPLFVVLVLCAPDSATDFAKDTAVQAARFVWQGGE